MQLQKVTIVCIKSIFLPLFLESTSSMFCLLLHKVSSDLYGTPTVLVLQALS